MEDYKTLIEQAYKEAKVADYMAYVTSKLVKDKKLVISIMEHMNKSFILSLNAYLTKERFFRRVPPVPAEPSLVIEMFFSECAKSLNVETSLKIVMQTINRAVKAYSDRGILLTKGEKYVFVSPNYELIDIKLDDVKKWLRQNITFVNMIRERLNA